MSGFIFAYRKKCQCFQDPHTNNCFLLDVAGWIFQIQFLILSFGAQNFQFMNISQVYLIVTSIEFLNFLTKKTSKALF